MLLISYLRVLEVILPPFHYKKNKELCGGCAKVQPYRQPLLTKFLMIERRGTKVITSVRDW